MAWPVGKPRFFHTSFVTAASQITPSSVATGRTSRAQKSGSGTGDMTASGDFSGSEDADYLAQIDATGTGELGSATFRWSDNDGQTIEASAVTTASAVQTLSSAVNVAFTSTAGATDYVAGDLWRFKAFLPYGKAKLIDRDPDTEWRGSTVASTVYLVFDALTDKAPSTLILYEHNLTSAATIRIQGSGDPAFGTLTVDEAVTWAADRIAHDITSVPRHLHYWRVALTDTGNPDGFPRIADVFLGNFTQPTRSFALGDIRRKRRLAQREQMRSGRWIGGLNIVVEEFELTFDALSADDKDALLAVYDALNDTTNRQVLPVYFVPDDDTLTDVILCEWDGPAEVQHDPSGPERGYTMKIRLVEIPRTVGD